MFPHEKPADCSPRDKSLVIGFQDIVALIIIGETENMAANIAPKLSGGTHTAVKQHILWQYVGAVQCPVNGLILGLAGLRGFQEALLDKLTFSSSVR